MRFELDHLESYDDDALLEEVRRVAKLVDKPKLSRKEYSQHAKVHSSTLEKRFGGWRATLKAAGLAGYVDDRSDKKTEEEIIDQIKVVANKLDQQSLTLGEFEAHTGITGAPVRRLFGSWSNALEKAGLVQSPLGKRYTDEQCFENMLNVWTHYGRPPQHDEMNEAPSEVGAKAYVRRWGTWRKSLQAFVERVNSGEEVAESATPKEENSRPKDRPEPKPANRGSRDVPLALRYYVLRRDHFRCVTCGASPAIVHGVVLHVDHIQPWAGGGATVADNLRTLCEACNLGKGAKPA